METVEISIPQSASYRASEIVADLRNAAEELFHPMQVVGYWDAPTADHLCPIERMQLDCPHAKAAEPGGPPCAITLEAYRESVEHERSGALELHFTHADVRVFLNLAERPTPSTEGRASHRATSVVMLPSKPGSEDGMSEGLDRGPASIACGAHPRRLLLGGERPTPELLCRGADGKAAP